MLMQTDSSKNLIDTNEPPAVRPTEHDLFTIHNMDARNLDQVINEPVVSLTVTSPPYFDLKDYGHSDQIGFGQTYDKYLNDLQIVFDKVYAATKEDGSLWVIIDTYRRDNEIVPLPFDFAARIRNSGWKLQDIIIWHKDRTVPWASAGTTRNIFEYVLVFSKSEKYKYYADRVRNHQELKRWWVKYPERYNPKGKSLNEVWEFGIPTQGSWGDGYIRHFCPLPEGLVDRIIRLTTDEGDVVLDPFSGSGTVPAQAAFMNRRHIGFELNPEYIQMFRKYLDDNLDKKRRQYNADIFQSQDASQFEQLILNLRALKFARVLFKGAKEAKLNAIAKIYVERMSTPPHKKHKLITVNYKILLNADVQDINAVRSKLEELISKPPLSKFGIEAVIEFANGTESFISYMHGKKICRYKPQCTHKLHDQVDDGFLLGNFPILSEIRVDLDENDYE